MKIQKLYDKRASIYDIAHHLQTLWADNKHRRLAIKNGNIELGDIVLDIGTGTALTAKIAAEIHPITYIFGVDFSQGMLEEAKFNIRGLNIQLVNANVEQLPFQDNTFDVVISAYGFGGIKNPEKAMQEILRVTKPSSRISFVEMIEPPSNYPIKKFVHNKFVEPWVKFFWHFRDLDYERLFKNHEIKIDYREFLSDRILGSTIAIAGYVEK